MKPRDTKSSPEPTIQIISSTTVPGTFYQRHRNILQGRGAQFVVATLIASGMTFLLWLWLPPLFRVWQTTLIQLAQALPLDNRLLLATPAQFPAWTHIRTLALAFPLEAPGILTLGTHLLGAVLLFAFAGNLASPFRAPLRLLACFHAVGVLACLFMRNGAAYSVEAHTGSLSLFTQCLLLTLPVVMAFTHFIVERSNERRVIATALIALYLVLTLPIKLIAHALVIQYASGLAEPTLFFIFGPALDIFVVTALYAWAISWRHGQG